jgi:hypothetical protein
MPRKQYLPPLERDELLIALQTAHKACVKAQQDLTIHCDTYDATSRLLYQMDNAAEAITGDRRFLQKPMAGKVIKHRER